MICEIVEYPRQQHEQHQDVTSEAADSLNKPGTHVMRRKAGAHGRRRVYLPVNSVPTRRSREKELLGYSTLYKFYRTLLQ